MGNSVQSGYFCRLIYFNALILLVIFIGFESFVAWVMLVG